MKCKRESKYSSLLFVSIMNLLFVSKTISCFLADTSNSLNHVKQHKKYLSETKGSTAFRQAVYCKGLHEQFRICKIIVLSFFSLKITFQKHASHTTTEIYIPRDVCTDMLIKFSILIVFSDFKIKQ